MVHILDGSSEHGAHGAGIWLHRKSRQIRFFFRKRPILFHCAQHILSYHLMYLITMSKEVDPTILNICKRLNYIRSDPELGFISDPYFFSSKRADLKLHNFYPDMNPAYENSEQTKLFAYLWRNPAASSRREIASVKAVLASSSSLNNMN